MHVKVKLKLTQRVGKKKSYFFRWFLRAKSWSWLLRGFVCFWSVSGSPRPKNNANAEVFYNLSTKAINRKWEEKKVSNYILKYCTYGFIFNLSNKTSK